MPVVGCTVHFQGGRNEHKAWKLSPASRTPTALRRVHSSCKIMIRCIIQLVLRPDIPTRMPRRKQLQSVHSKTLVVKLST